MKAVSTRIKLLFSDGSGLEILSDPRLQGLTAVKEGRVYDVDARTLIRIGGKLDSLVRGIHGALMSRPVARVEDDAA